ncbi:MAG: hypothetical protein OXG24_04455 [Gammaproteobacteria bacterium]|nr:hypothetical protein [Gammaproteobacteria bacterium]
MARDGLKTTDYLAMSVDSLNEAETLLEHGTYRGVLNRLNYAAYYAACSALTAGYTKVT